MSAFLGTLLGLVPASARAQCSCHPDQGIFPTDGIADQFGSSVAVHASFMVTGAPYSDLSVIHSGAAYVHQFDGTSWNEIQRLEPADAAFNDLFGSSVDLDGSNLVVGAVLDGSGANNGGAVYVFRPAGGIWSETQQLLPSDLGVGDSFGQCLALDGRWLVVGAPNANTVSLGKAGCAYVYEWTGAQWVEFTKLEAPSPASYDHFGSSVAIDGGRLAVGSPDDDTIAAEGGAVSLFRFDGTQWVPDGTLTASDATVDGGFGVDVDLSGSLLAVGSRAEQAYVYRHDGAQWQESILVGSDTQWGDEFGLTVAVDGMVLVGAPSAASTTGFDAGAVYAFRHDSVDWREVLKSGSSSPTLGFGRAVDIVRDRLVAGASDSSATGSVHTAFVPELALDSSPSTLLPGSSVRLSTCGGSPANLMALFVMQVDGSPFVQLLFTAPFDAGGAWSWQGTVPNDPSYQGLSFDLQSFGLKASGRVAATNLESITIL